MSDERPEEPLPFECEYEVGVMATGNTDEWDCYHPMAKTMGSAKEKAIEEARGDGMEAPVVYMATGPYPPQDPMRVGEEMIREVFGDV